MTRPINAAIASIWLIFGCYMIGRTTGFWTLILGALAIGMGAGMLGTPPEVKR